MKILCVNPNTTQAVTDIVLAEARRHAAPGTQVAGVTAGSGVAIVTNEAENALAARAALDLVSAHHAEIKLESGHVTLEDQNSAHGTWANGKRVMQAPLTEHMQFRIGQSTFALVLPGRSAPAPSANDARLFVNPRQRVEHVPADGDVMLGREVMRIE